MNPTPFCAAVKGVMGQAGNAAPPLSLRSLVRRSALLNSGIVLSARPVFAAAGGRNAVIPAVAVLVAVSVVLWAATFAAFSLVSLARILFDQGSAKPRPPQGHPDGGGGLADEWSDGPA
jgi:hypothetical protein